MLDDVQFYAKRNTLLSSPGLFWYLRSHLAKGCTKPMEMKPCCSDTVQSSVVVWWRDAECNSHGRSLAGPLSLLGVNAASVRLIICIEHWTLVLFFAFFHKSENPLGFFQIAKPGTNVGLVYQRSGVKGTSEKWEIPVFIQWNLKVRLYMLGEKTGVLRLLDHV